MQDEAGQSQIFFIEKTEELLEKLDLEERYTLLEIKEKLTEAEEKLVERDKKLAKRDKENEELRKELEALKKKTDTNSTISEDKYNTELEKMMVELETSNSKVSIQDKFTTYNYYVQGAFIGGSVSSGSGHNFGFTNRSEEQISFQQVQIQQASLPPSPNN